MPKHNALIEYLSIPQKVLDMIPGNISWKTIDGHYLGCNLPIVKGLELNSTNDMIGRTLLEVYDKKYALPLLENDHKVIASNKEIVFEEVFPDTEGNLALYISRKAPLRDNDGKVIGLINTAIAIPSTFSLHHDSTSLIQPESETADSLLKKIITQSDGNTKRNFLPPPFDKIYLTQRELDCILSLLKGHSAKLIGRNLGLSPRTVEFYISRIKIKFDCRTTPELISILTSLISKHVTY